MNKILPDNRLSGDSPIEQARIVMIKLLDTFVHICEENNLRYWLDGGTLIGAVRHKGFIPWDDDIDVTMPMKDYKKFLKIVKREVTNDIYILSRKFDRGYPLLFVKMVDAYSVIDLKENWEGGFSRLGIYIDIAPIVDYPRFFSPEKLKEWAKRVVILYFNKMRIARAEMYRCSEKISYKYAKKKIQYFGYCVELFFHRIGFKLMNFFSFNRQIYCNGNLENNFYAKLHKKDALYPLSWVEFEGKRYLAPANVDQYLREVYGDYMNLPDKGEQVSHCKAIFPCEKSNHPLAKEWPKG